MATASSRGKVSLVGAGPGHPDYLTLKGLRVLQAADVVVHDALLDKSFSELFPKEAQILFVGKRAGKHSIKQPDLNALLIDLAWQGKQVVRLKGGDPFVFGRGGEEWLALSQAGVTVEVVPGVSALSAVAACGGLPLTHRGLSNKVLLLEGHETTLARHDWQHLAQFDGTLALFMATLTIQYIAQQLLAAGKNAYTPVALIENGGLKTQQVQVTTLAEVAERGFCKRSTGPGMVYIGEVVSLSGQLRQQAQGPHLQVVSAI